MASMSSLVYLYPRAWRERYGDEFLELLEGRPATPRLAADVILGAIDARLRPQVSPARDAAIDGAVAGAVGDIRGNLAMGLMLIHIEAVLRLAALYDPGLKDYLRELSAATSAPGPFLVPKFLCGERATARVRGGQARAPIVTTGVRRPMASARTQLAAEPS